MICPRKSYTLRDSGDRPSIVIEHVREPWETLTMCIHTVETPQLLDDLRAWTPPGIRFLLTISIAIGVVSIYLDWSAIPFNSFAIFTAIAAISAYKHREHRIARTKYNAELATVYAYAVADIIVERQQDS